MWTRCAFPTWRHFDVLRGLEYLRSADVVPDGRVAEAVDLVASKRDGDGRWPLEIRYSGVVPPDIDVGEGQPSRWNTLRALQVLDCIQDETYADDAGMGLASEGRTVLEPKRLIRTRHPPLRVEILTCAIGVEFSAASSSRSTTSLLERSPLSPDVTAHDAMPILCFEGPSAVGKTATAAALATHGDVRVIPEVNHLFERPENESPWWYFERQVERWTLAREACRDDVLVILDGDPFQPLWYNWSYGFVGWQGLDFMEAFYRPRLVGGELSFPDRYIVFDASEQTLRERRQADQTRRRRGFETHLRFIKPQRRYFEAMQAFSPGRVRILDAEAVDMSARTIRMEAEEIEAELRPVDLFDYLIEWLQKHPAA